MTAETRTLCVKCTPGDYAVCVQALALLTNTTGLTKGEALAHALRSARPRPPPKPISDRQARTAKARAVRQANVQARLAAKYPPQVTEPVPSPDLPSGS